MKNKYRVCKRNSDGKYFIQERYKILFIRWWVTLRTESISQDTTYLHDINVVKEFMESLVRIDVERIRGKDKSYKVIDTEK